MAARKVIKDEQLEEFGERVRAWRKERHLDQLALAKQSGYKNSNAITQIEKGQMYPTLEKIFLMAKALNIPTSAFFPPNPGQHSSPYDALYETSHHLPEPVVEALMMFLITWMDYREQDEYEG